jgi:hypothetical protein
MAEVFELRVIPLAESELHLAAGYFPVSARVKVYRDEIGHQIIRRRLISEMGPTQRVLLRTDLSIYLPIVFPPV